jgi:phosphoglycerol transferase MdoB-like AlkP superfamily enzyme
MTGFMKFTSPTSPGKRAWFNNRPFLLFMMSLLLVHSVLKIIFYQYNHQLLFTADASATATWKIMKWSLMEDLLVLCTINAVFLFALWLGKFASSNISKFFIVPIFVVINSFAVLLNLVDIFYFPFHFQRANADLLYVWKNGFNHLGNWMLLLAIITIALIVLLLNLLHRKFYRAFVNGRRNNVFLVIFFLLFTAAAFSWRSVSKTLHPAYPLLELPGSQLPFAQNSMHTFTYSVFRKGEVNQLKASMSAAACDSLVPIRKTVAAGTGKQNVVLFIMESVPYEFFDTASSFKVQMPFFDSLLKVSSFYNNAFCYALESNKGITAILAGLPTVTDMPVYHSGYLNMPVTQIGTALKKQGYSSLFCIGDDHDNFGFAKCMNWLGIDNYYSKEDIPGYKKLPAHTMGIQDEYVLDFFRKKITEQRGPFLAINFNISTHYPYDVPPSFLKTMPSGYTAPMKAMRYYDHSLQQFFASAKNEDWFRNTLFIFCSDHWLFPEGKREKYDQYRGFRIPILVYDPSLNRREIIQYPVSQFDVMGTILQAAGYRDSIISYGTSLLDSNTRNRIVFTRANANLYQAFDSSYVLGYNNAVDKPEFLFNYRTDKKLRQNLVRDASFTLVRNNLLKQIQAFIQKTRMQQRAEPFR